MVIKKPNITETSLQATYQKFWQKFNSFSAANDEFCKVFKIHTYGSTCSYQDYLIGKHIRVVAGIDFNQKQIRVGANIINVDPSLFFNEIYNYFDGIKGELHMDTQGRTTTACVFENVEFDENHGWEIVYEKLISYMLQMNEALLIVRNIKLADYHREPNRYEVIDRNTIFDGGYLKIYYKKRNNQIYIYNIYDPHTGTEHEELRCIEKNYSHINSLLFGCIEYGEETDFAYVLLWDDLGRLCVKELISGNVILDGFNKCHLQKIHRILDEDGKLKDLLFFVNKWGANDKEFYIFSLLEKYKFGPYKYSDINQYEYGFVIDEKYVVEFSGFVVDISGYKKIDEENIIYYNEKSDSWFILVDEAGELFYYLDDSDYSEIKEAEIGAYKYSYNIKTKELKKHEMYFSDYDRDYDRDAWDAMTDGQYGDYPGFNGWDNEIFGY